jgi:hypothetical protein
MKFCYECGRTTRGEPLFCNSCGRSYGVKLCPKLHANPRFAEACSRCGSHDLSVPQPTVPFAFLLAAWLTQGFSGLLLAIVSIRFVLYVIGVLAARSEDYETFIFIVVLAISWLLWALLPTFLRRLIHRALKALRRRE